MKRKYQICSNCVMDTSDPDIQFNKIGICNHCTEFKNITSKNWLPNKKGQEYLNKIISKIKENSKGRDFDSIIGLSGGVDSSYLALKMKEWGLKPLVIHVDAGWNSEIAVSNIEKIVNYCKYDLYTKVINWEDMKNLQLAYLSSGISNQDTPQDHIFFSTIYNFAIKNKIKYVFTGGNIATESIFPKSWHGEAMDAINLKAIHKKFGSKKLIDYKTVSFMELYFLFPFIYGIKPIRPLNFIPYNRDLALDELKTKINWSYYGQKHGESIFTKLFQNYILPTRYGYDKRRPHLSSLIVSGQMKREEAIKKLKMPLYKQSNLKNDIDYFCKKLQISKSEFENFMNLPIVSHKNFPTWDKFYNLMKYIQSLVFKFLGVKLNKYS